MRLKNALLSVIRNPQSRVICGDFGIGEPMFVNYERSPEMRFEILASAARFSFVLEEELVVVRVVVCRRKVLYQLAASGSLCFFLSTAFRAEEVALTTVMRLSQDTIFNAVIHMLPDVL